MPRSHRPGHAGVPSVFVRAAREPLGRGVRGVRAGRRPELGSHAGFDARAVGDDQTPAAADRRRDGGPSTAARGSGRQVALAADEPALADDDAARRG